MALIQAGGIRLALRGLGERGTVFAGHLFSIAAYLALGIVTSGTLALILTPLAALAGIIPPALQGIMSQRVADDAQGELQGALTSTSSLAMILSPLAMTWTFARFTESGAPIYLPGAPFVLSMVLAVLGLALFLLRPRRKNLT